jgi:4-phytase / acid phosphatase
MRLSSLCLASLLALVPVTAAAQSQPAAPSEDSELRYVVYLSRHGVRSPTGKAAQYRVYSAAPWPEWPVAPGYLTPHGFHLMELFGSYDRSEFASQRLLQPTGCSDANNVTIYADSDQRTRETGKALAQGLMPGCNIPVQSLLEGTNDPLFHPVPTALLHLDPTLANAAIAGRVGGNVANLTQAYRPQIATLDKLLATCGASPGSPAKRTSLFDIAATLAPGAGDHLADLKGPINTASTLAENLLLEYTEGMADSKVGWGCVHRTELESLMDLHTAAVDFAQRTPEIARSQASNILDHILLSIQQATTRKPVPGAIGKPTDRVLLLVGHDTNLENIAGLLQLNWIVDGRRDDTPPGGAMIFEVRQKPATGEYIVRAYFTAQTLDQMRSSSPLTGSNPPERVALFIPACSGKDLSCTLSAFTHSVEQVIDKGSIAAH